MAIKKVNCSEVTNFLREIESKITLGDRSNQLTMYYFAHIAYYHYCGGKISTEKIIEKSTILGHMPTEKAKQSYIKNAKLYDEVGLIFIKLNNLVKDIDYTNYNEIFYKIQKAFANKNLKITRQGGYICIVGCVDSIYTETLLYRDKLNFIKWFIGLIGKCTVKEFKSVENTFLEIMNTLNNLE